MLGVAEGFQGAGVPGAAALGAHAGDRLLGDPGLAGAGRGGDQAVAVLDRRQGLQLEAVGSKGFARRDADAGKHPLEPRIGRRGEAPGFRRAGSFAAAVGVGAVHGG